MYKEKNSNVDDRKMARKGQNNEKTNTISWNPMCGILAGWLPVLGKGTQYNFAAELHVLVI
jgi:hypothetical protein